MSDPKTPPRTPRHFWAVVALALFWNGRGAYDWLMSFEGADYYRTVGMTPPQIAYQLALPAWVQSAWSIGVWTGILGTVLLIVRRRQAFPVFLLTVITALAGLAHQTLLSNGAAVLGPLAYVSWATLAVSAFLAWYAWRMAGRGLLG
jgi:hypothetical protein